MIKKIFANSYFNFLRPRPKSCGFWLEFIFYFITSRRETQDKAQHLWQKKIILKPEKIRFLMIISRFWKCNKKIPDRDEQHLKTKYQFLTEKKNFISPGLVLPSVWAAQGLHGCSGTWSSGSPCWCTAPLPIFLSPASEKSKLHGEKMKGGKRI